MLPVLTPYVPSRDIGSVSAEVSPRPRAMNGEDIQQETKWQRYPVIKIRSL